MTLYDGGSMGEKEIENLTKVLRDTEKDLRYYISENGNLRVENKELKEEVQKLKNENKGNILGQYIESLSGYPADSLEYQALCEGVQALMETRRG